jgi:hypothetical protein
MGTGSAGWMERPEALIKVVIATDGRTYTLETMRQLLDVARDEDSCRILSQLTRSGRSPVAGGRLVVR